MSTVGLIHSSVSYMSHVFVPVPDFNLHHGFIAINPLSDVMDYSVTSGIMLIVAFRFNSI